MPLSPLANLIDGIQLPIMRLVNPLPDPREGRRAEFTAHLVAKGHLCGRECRGIGACGGQRAVPLDNVFIHTHDRGDKQGLMTGVTVAGQQRSLLCKVNGRLVQMRW